MSEQTAKEVKQRYLDAMGNELGHIYYAFCCECTELHWEWNELMTLFGSEPERVDLLNSAAPSFFKLVHDFMWEGILLHFARMTDSPISCGRRNLSLRRLPDLVDSEIRSEVEKLLALATESCEFARNWRNRRIAHRDLGLALQEAKPLTPASRKSVGDALQAISAILNCLESHYCHGIVAYDLLVAPLDGAHALLRVLRDGVAVSAARKRRIQSGQFSAEDIAATTSLVRP